MNYWLKSLGTHKERIPTTGLASIEWITDDIGFPVDPNVRPGDRLVLYASGSGQIFAVVALLVLRSVLKRHRRVDVAAVD